MSINTSSMSVITFHDSAVMNQCIAYTCVTTPVCKLLPTDLCDFGIHVVELRVFAESSVSAQAPGHTFPVAGLGSSHRCAYIMVSEILGACVLLVFLLPEERRNFIYDIYCHEFHT
jgi:hypothetical protein